MTQAKGRVDGAVAEQVAEDKSMARLAEILMGKGVKVLGYKEQECCIPPRLSFRGGYKWQHYVEDLVVELGYPVVSSSDTSYYQSTGKFKWSGHDYVMEFEFT